MIGGYPITKQMRSERRARAEAVQLANKRTPAELPAVSDAAHAVVRQAKAAGVWVFGGGIDESPQAYKPIDEVISAQHDLVDVIGKFTPRIVRMADEPGDI